MILVHVLIKISIITLCVIVFLVTFILNKKTKAPKVDEKIKKCRTCTNESCVIKMSELEEIKKEYEREFEKNNLDNNIKDIIDNCHEEENNEKQ